MPASESQQLRELYEFGPFRIDPEKEILLRAGEPVPLQPKTFQILLVLVRHNRELVSKDDLMKTVWPDTFVEETNLSRNIFMLRKALGESSQDHQYILTVPGRGYRLAENVRLVPEQELSIVAANHSKVEVQIAETKPWGWFLLAAIMLLAVGAGTTWFLHRRNPVLTGRDTVVLADFANSTGDPVFDGTLREGLAVELEQSPFLSLIPDQRIQQTLRLMDQPPDVRLTPQIAYDLCERTQSAAYLTGSIASLGTQYVVGLRAVSCPTGELLAEEQETASGKEQILGALDKAAGRLREKLGESLSTVQKFDTPLELATTPSLDALQAYSLGRQMMVGKGNFVAAIPFFERAISLDRNFAMAHAALGSVYWSLGETNLSAGHVRRAYELRARVSEREKFYIDSTYYHYVTGDLEKARQIYEIEAQTYPRYFGVPTRLGILYSQLGQYDTALAQIREALRLDPTRAVNYGNLLSSYIDLNQLKEAQATAQEAPAKHPDSVFVQMALYRLAFLQSDTAGMANHVRGAMGLPGAEDMLLEAEARTAAYSGELRKSRRFSQQAVASAIQAKKKEAPCAYGVRAALWEALYGNIKEARLRNRSALCPSAPQIAQYGTALALALANDAVGAQRQADNLAKRSPDDTIVRFNYLPTIQAQLALDRGQPSKAVEVLQAAAPYELGSVGISFYPVYLRGNAYLTERRGPEAAAEYQKILDHCGIVANDPIGALAHLQLGRAYALMGDNTKAKIEYREFLTLWKDADRDIPILSQAKREFSAQR
jgi:eukaryotic-like serine/threonine-protein kinase